MTKLEATKLAQDLYQEGKTQGEIAICLRQAGYVSPFTKKPLGHSAAFKLAKYGTSSGYEYKRKYQKTSNIKTISAFIGQVIESDLDKSTKAKLIDVLL